MKRHFFQIPFAFLSNAYTEGGGIENLEEGENSHAQL